MAVTDVWSDWSATAASNSPAGGATPEIDDEIRNIKAQCKANAVALSGTQIIAGAKTFSTIPIISDAAAVTADSQVATKEYVDSAITADAVLLTGNQTCSGVKTFASLPVGPSAAPTTDYQMANKKYVDDSLEMASANYLRYAYVVGSSTAGGTATASGWQIRPINTEVTDVPGIGSLSADKVTLPAGTYYAKASCAFFYTGYTRTRLYNYTDSAELMASVAITCPAADYDQKESNLNGYFTLSGTKQIEVQYQIQTTANTYGLGYPASFADVNETYLILEIWKVT